MITLDELTSAQRQALDWLPGDGSWALSSEEEMVTPPRGDGLWGLLERGFCRVRRGNQWRLTPAGLALKAERERRAEALSELARLDGETLDQMP